MSRRQRITTAVVLAPLPILAVLFLPTPWLAAIVALVLLAGLWEWTHFAGVHERLPRAAFLTANALLMAALVWGGGPSLFTLKLMSLVGVLWWALVCLWLARPELALVEESCPAEQDLHAALMDQPTRQVPAAELDAAAKRTGGSGIRTASRLR